MVSIITVTYNRAPLISETIRSVLDQSFKDFEYIIIDDGSADNTRDVVQSFHDSRISYHFYDHTGSISKLRNIGLSKCKGSEIIFIDSDDLWKPQLLHVLVNALQQDETIGFTFSDAEGFNAREVFVQHVYNGERIKNPDRNFFYELVSDPSFFILTPCFLFRKKCLEVVGILDEQINHGDKDFMCRLTFHFKGRLIPLPLAMVRRHESNITATSTEEIMKTELYTLKKLFDAHFISKKTFRKVNSFYYQKLAAYYFKEANFSEAGKSFKEVFSNNNFRVDAALKYIFCLWKGKTK